MPKALQICTAQINDCEGICRVQRSAITILCGGHYTPEEIEAWVGPKRPEDYVQAIQDEVVLVSKLEGQVVGFAQMTRHDGVIKALYVDPNHARCGIGSRLLAALEGEAQTLGRAVITIVAPLNAVSFCLSKGFSSLGERTRRARSGVSIPCVDLQKRL